jgi:hypothetical protein
MRYSWLNAIQEGSEDATLNTHEITVNTKPQPLKQDLPWPPVVCVLIIVVVDDWLSYGYGILALYT